MIFGWTAWPILFDERLQKLCILRLVLPRQHGELRQYPVPHRIEPAALIPALWFPGRLRGHLSGIYALATSSFHDGSAARFHIVLFHFFPQIITWSELRSTPYAGLHSLHYAPSAHASLIV